MENTGIRVHEQVSIKHDKHVSDIGGKEWKKKMHC